MLYSSRVLIILIMEDLVESVVICGQEQSSHGRGMSNFVFFRDKYSRG